MLTQRHLNFNKFLQQRAEQISKFRDILKLQTKKKGHQALPKSIRRRAMSHNRFRIPLKMRKLNQQQLIKNQNIQRIPKSRKHIRKRSRLILSYKNRFSKIKWLSTHLWAAKRMRMINYYGYKVAQTPNQKMFRTSYRHFRHNCCVRDVSYYQCVNIENIKNSQLLKNIVIVKVNRNNKQKIQSLQQLNENLTYNGHLLNSTNNKLICPLIIFKSNTNSIKCFFHPAALQQVKNQFNKINQQQYKYSTEKSKSQIYQLIGPEWANKIVQALKIYGFTNLNNNQAQNLKYRQSIAKYFVADQQKVTKNEQKIPYISAPIDSMIKQTFNVNEMSKSIREKTLSLFSKLKNNSSPYIQSFLMKPQQQSNSLRNKFWQFYQSLNNQQIKFFITNRSKYTHKRKNKLSKQNKKKYINLQKLKKQLIINTNKNIISQQQPQSQQMISQSLQSIKNQIKQIFIQSNNNLINEDKNNMMNINNKNKQFKIQPVLISNYKYSNMCQGCYVFCSDNDNCRLWRILTKLNVKVVGLQQYQHISLQGQCLNFPQDYPQTQSFKQLCQTNSIKQFNRFKRRPPQKRINFLKVHSPNPFSCYQEQLIRSQSPTVFIQMVNKGRCFSDSYIYQLNNEDIKLIDQKLQNSGQIGIVLSQTSSPDSKDHIKFINQSKVNKKLFFDYSKQTYQQLTTLLSTIKTKRKLIGRITTGGYLFSKSKQGGIGYISKQIGNNIQNLQNQVYVLIRKVSSPFYYLAEIKNGYGKQYQYQ